ncbi:MAG: glycosyltransferase family 9 protein [Candidatus Zixiibacteriota bacterium]|nr:MAG: glycosyltransferase family 9 protein [candidate division Zixibacteria bacterium]
MKVMRENPFKPIEHWFKDLFFSAFRGFLKKGRTDFRPVDGRRTARVLFLRPEKIGDMIISFPVFDGLKRHFPHIKIAVLGSPRNYAIIKNDPRFDRVFLYRKSPLRDIRELMAMRREKYDCVIDMIGNDSVTALFLSQLCAPGKPRIGVGKQKYREYYDFNYDHRRGNTGHIIENTLKLLEAFAIDSESISCYSRPYINERADTRARDFIGTLTNGDRSILKIGYNMSAGSPTRIWAEEKSTDLLKRLLRFSPGCRIVLFTVPSERKRGLRLKEQLGEGVEIVPDGIDLIGASALINYLDIMITPDTSLVHIARAFEVPVVGLYSRYMKNFLLWRPYGQHSGAVVSGCDGNIFDITVDQVYDTFVELVEEYSLVNR